jgi:ribosomal protein L30
MGRNPAVGRQGPAHHAAVIPAEAAASGPALEKRHSGICPPNAARRTLRALGLRHHQQVVRVPNTSSIRGMLTKVRHLVEVTPAQES